jgi:hypothetical protein
MNRERDTKTPNVFFLGCFYFQCSKNVQEFFTVFGDPVGMIWGSNSKEDTGWYPPVNYKLVYNHL